MAEVTIQELKEIAAKYEFGIGILHLKKAIEPAEKLFDGDILTAILYIMADGYAISVGSNLPPEKRRAARLRWNENMARNQAARLREKYDA